MATSGVTAKVAFKKKKTRKRSRRKNNNTRRKTKDKESYGGLDDGDTSSLIQDILSEQKIRARSSGINTTQAKKARTDDSDSEEEPDGYDPNSGGIVPQNKLAMLATGFAQEEGDGTEKEDPRMLEYVARKMGENEPEEVVTPRTKRANLYAFPENIEKARTGADVDDDTHGTGGPVPFITGIAEVELPVEYKLKNIEATELAKLSYIAQKNNKASKKIDDMASHGTGGNFNSNFKQHDRDFHKRRRQRFLRDNPDAAKNPAHEGNGERWQTSSDDRMMRRFMKRSGKFRKKSCVSYA